MLNLRNLYDMAKTLGTEWTTKYPPAYDIFDGLTLPEDSPFDLETVKSTIMEHCGLCIPIYAQPDVMRDAITLWSAKNQWTFKHLANIYLAEYSPIENVYEEDSQTTVSTGSKNINGHATVSGTSHEANSGSDHSTTENTVSAYNASSYQPDNKIENTINYGQIKDGTDSQTKDTTTSDTSNGSNTFTRLRHGNVGVTTNNALIQEELQMLKKFDAYTFIAEKFENDLCIVVY